MLFTPPSPQGAGIKPVITTPDHRGDAQGSTGPCGVALRRECIANERTNHISARLVCSAWYCIRYRCVSVCVCVRAILVLWMD